MPLAVPGLEVLWLSIAHRLSLAYLEGTTEKLEFFCPFEEALMISEGHVRILFLKNSMLRFINAFDGGNCGGYESPGGSRGEKAIFSVQS